MAYIQMFIAGVGISMNFKVKTENLICCLFLGLISGVVFTIPGLIFGPIGALFGFIFGTAIVIGSYYDSHDYTKLWFAQSPESLQKRQLLQAAQKRGEELRAHYERLKKLEAEEQFQVEYQALLKKYKS